MASRRWNDEAQDAALTGARRIAARLLLREFDAPVPLTVRPVSRSPWLRRLLGYLPAQTEVSASAPALIVGCVWAAMEACAVLSRPLNGSFDVDRVVDMATAAPRVPRSGWRGYVRVGGGWVSLALGPGERESWHRLLASLGGPAELGPGQVADIAQRWGIACLPVNDRRGDLLVPTGELDDVGRAEPRLVRFPDRGAPLHGMTVVDVGSLVSAPVAAALLAALGADVSAWAHPARAGTRWYGPPARALDLTLPDARGAFADLCRRADLVIDNFSPRVWPNLGLDPISLGARSHLSLPAFPEGPRRHERAFGFQTDSFFGIGCAPKPGPEADVAAPRGALMDHAVGFTAAVHVIARLIAGRSGRSEVSHAGVAALVA